MKKIVYFFLTHCHNSDVVILCVQFSVEIFLQGRTIILTYGHIISQGKIFRRISNKKISSP